MQNLADEAGHAQRLVGRLNRDAGLAVEDRLEARLVRRIQQLLHALYAEQHAIVRGHQRHLQAFDDVAVLAANRDAPQRSDLAQGGIQREGVADILTCVFIEPAPRLRIVFERERRFGSVGVIPVLDVGVLTVDISADLLSQLPDVLWRQILGNFQPGAVSCKRKRHHVHGVIEVALLV